MVPNEVFTGLVMGARKTNASTLLMVTGDFNGTPLFLAHLNRMDIFYAYLLLPIIKKKSPEDSFWGFGDVSVTLSWESDLSHLRSNQIIKSRE
jgi:hypothetical protein